MKYRNVRIVLRLIAVFCSFALAGAAQQTSSGEPSTTSSTNSAVVPRLVNYSGVLTDVNGKPLTGVVGVTFALYQDSEGGTPLWMEIQNVQASKSGHYSVMLGSASSVGLPQDVFVTGEARWLGVQAEGQAEQPRVLLVAVPYALKAGDAETIGGLPPSAFVLANRSQRAASGAKASSPLASAGVQKNSVPPANPDVTGKGLVNYIPMWNTTSDIVDSIIFQKTSEIGINTTTPAATLDVNGKADIRNTLTLFPKGTDSTLAISGTAFNIDQTGKMTFISGQTFPGTGDGTITGVTAGTDLTGGGPTGDVTLNLDTTKVPQLKAANTFTGNQTITGNLSDTGNISSTGSITGQTGSFSGNNSSQIVNITQSGGGNGISATSTSGVGLSGVGIYGVQGQSATVGGPGVYGIATAAGSEGVFGVESATSGTNYGVYGQNASAIGAGASGMSTSGTGMGVLGQAPGSTFSGTGASLAGKYAFGVAGDTSANGIFASGVMGTADDAIGVLAENNGPTFGTIYAVNDTTTFNKGATVFAGFMPGVLGSAAVVFGDAGCASGFMALQLGSAFSMGDCKNYTLLGDTTGNTYVNAVGGADIHFRLGNGEQMTITNGNVDVLGTLSKGGGSFKIDHPLDPANKYLYHSFVESPDMKNMYDGNVTTNDAGLATVTLSDWFETLNRDFRYQLTVIGQFAQAIVASEISGNQFSIRTDKPNVKVSWQVTGTRQDAFANAHRIQVEVEKAAADRGRYLYPELVGAPETARIGYMAPAPGGEHIVHHRLEMPRRGNAAPPPQRTPLSIPIPRRPAPPNLTPPLHSVAPAAQGNKPGVNQR